MLCLHKSDLLGSVESDLHSCFDEPWCFYHMVAAATKCLACVSTLLHGVSACVCVCFDSNAQAVMHKYSVVELCLLRLKYASGNAQVPCVSVFAPTETRKWYCASTQCLEV